MPSPGQVEVVDVTHISRLNAKARQVARFNRGLIAETLKGVFIGAPFLIITQILHPVPTDNHTELVRGTLAASVVVVPLLFIYYIWHVAIKKRRTISHLFSGVAGLIAASMMAFGLTFGLTSLLLNSSHRTLNWGLHAGIGAAILYSCIHLYRWVESAVNAVRVARAESRDGIPEPPANFERGQSLYTILGLPPGFMIRRKLGCRVFIVGLFAILLEGFSFDMTVIASLPITVAATSLKYSEGIDKIAATLRLNGIVDSVPAADLIAILINLAIYFLLARLLFKWARRIRKWMARQVREDVDKRRTSDPRPPLVFFRPFNDDSLELNRKRSAYLWDAQGHDEDGDSIEEVLVARYRLFAPVFAIGNPRDLDIPAGASRAYVKDNSWQSVASAFIQEARAIVICCNKSEGVLWEFSEIVSRHALSKAVVLIHPAQAKDASYLQKIMAMAGVEFNLNAAAFQSGEISNIGICFMTAGRATLFQSKEASGESYIVALKSAMNRILASGRPSLA
jgi:hypothetical protein